jgi:GMP synthase (glutamine-hydrolysing)
MPTPSSFDRLRVLLVQARATSDMERQEQQCFLERCHLSAPQLASVNVIRDPVSDDLLDGVHALLVGGAGEYSAMNNYPWMPVLLDLIRAARERRLPTFGSCWGHQVIARAFGGTVVHDSEQAELGCLPVRLTDAGQRDTLFSRFPPRFKANMGHHDRVVELPPDAVELARNDQPHQAFRMAGLPIYGTQFHSELDAQRERERLLVYREYYRADMPDEGEFEAVLNSLAETTEVDHLLHDFLMTYALPFADAAVKR